MKKFKVLWVEDGAFTDLAEYVGPLYIEGDYDLTVALNVSDAIRQIKNQRFNGIIVDIRLPPGRHPAWREFYMQRGENKVSAKLGLEFIRLLLKPGSSSNLLKTIINGMTLQWIRPSMIGVFSMEEGQTRQKLEELGVKTIVEKSAKLASNILLDLVREIENKIKNDPNM